MTKPHWVGVDWGISNLRAFAVDAKGRVLDQRSSDRGMGTLKPSEFEAVLLDLIEPWLAAEHVLPVYACGMVGARQGWFEAAYRDVPCQPVTSQKLTSVQTVDRRIQVKILPGLSQSKPPDVMRGEETQIGGLLALHPDFTGAVCLPGTHSKWANIVDGKVSAFQTFMTGELFAIISKHSVLRHCLCHTDLDRAVFFDVALSTIASPLKLSTDLFGLRAASLLQDQKPDAASARLSGMLIGQELALTRDLWDGSKMAVIASSEIAGLYTETLTRSGADVLQITASEATLSGLKIAAGVAGDATSLKSAIASGLVS